MSRPTLSHLTPAELFAALYITENISGITAISTDEVQENTVTRGNGSAATSYSNTLIITNSPYDRRFLTVRGSSLSATERATRTLLNTLPAQVLAREVTNRTNGHHVLIRTILNPENGRCEGILSRLTTSVDDLNEDARWQQAFELAQNSLLLEVTLLPSVFSNDEQYGIGNTVQFVLSFTDLIIAVVKFNPIRDIEMVLPALQGHARLTHLAVLIGDRSPIWTPSHEDRRRLSNALSTGLEGLAHLQYLVIDPWLYDISNQVRETILGMANLQAPANTELPVVENCEQEVLRYFRSTL